MKKWLLGIILLNSITAFADCSIGIVSEDQSMPLYSKDIRLDEEEVETLESSLEEKGYNIVADSVESIYTIIKATALCIESNFGTEDSCITTYSFVEIRNNNSGEVTRFDDSDDSLFSKLRYKYASPLRAYNNVLDSIPSCN